MEGCNVVNVRRKEYCNRSRYRKYSYNFLDPNTSVKAVKIRLFSQHCSDVSPLTVTCFSILAICCLPFAA
jgi:hypothetical protein